jgi:ribose transport system substrate-binding protein
VHFSLRFRLFSTRNAKLSFAWFGVTSPMFARRFFLLAGCLAGLSFSACNKPQAGPAKTLAAGDKVKVGIVSNNAEDFWTICEAGAKKGSGEFNADLFFRRPTSGNASEQREIIDDLMTQGVNGIAISVNDPKNQINFLNRIAERIPLVTQDNDAPDSKRLCYIGTNNYQAGLAAGKLVKEALPDGGTIAIFVGQADPVNARERRQAVLDELAGEKDSKGPKRYGKYTLLDTFYDDVKTDVCKEKVATALVQLQNEANVCFVGLWAYNPPAILSAVKDANKQGKVKIVGFDEMPNTLQGIKDGFIQGTIVQQPYQFGYQSVKILCELARGDKSHLPANGIMDTPFLVIKKDNVEEFHAKLKKLLNQQ